MARHEVLAILQQQARILPEFTALVWQKLEEQNAEFFAAYRLGLRLKDQILCFNALLEQHASLAAAARGATPPPLPGIGAPLLSSTAVSAAVTAAAAALHAGGPPYAHTYGYLAEPPAASLPAPSQPQARAPLPRIFSLSDLSVELTAQLGEGGEGDGHAALMSSLHFSGGPGELLLPGGGGGMRRFDSYSKLPHSFSLSDMGALFTSTAGEAGEHAALAPPPGPPALVQGGC